MRVDLVVVCVAAVALSLPALSTCDPLYVMSAPNLLRVGTPEKVFVEAQDYSGGDLNVKITVMNYPKKNTELTSTSVTLKKDNQYMVLADITIPEGKEYFEEDDTLNQYVYLQAQFPGHLLQKVVLVSFQSGYIFVQTDKTIYTPSSTVMYRVFSLTPALQPVESGISVEIMTPDGITISKEVVHPKGGIKSGEHKLPDLVSFGTWKVVTRFVGTPQRNFTAEFEVKEYVLPSFEVSLTPGKAFFYIDDPYMTVDIVARYLYGKDVTGIAFVAFGVMIKGNEKRSLAGSLQRVEIREGKGQAVLQRDHITQTFPDINQLVGSTLYVSVSVLTETGSEMVEAQKRGIPIVTSPYTIHFKKTPEYFKPGMPFHLSVFVTNPDNSPAERVDVEVTAEGQTVKTNTGSNGIAKASINTRGGVDTVDINVRTKDPGLTDARQATDSMRAHSYKTTGGSNNYLHIDVNAAEVAIGDQVKIILFVGASPGVQDQDFTYLILSKGQLVQAKRFKRQGQALVILSLPVTKDMVPSFRIVAYYHVGSSEVVSDSVWVDVKDTCMGTLKVEASRPTAVYSLHHQYSLKITGDPGARLGLVAVDKGVYILNSKHRLTQTKIWDVIERYDTGCTAGSGKDSMGVFFDAGLVFQSSTAGGTEIRLAPTCPTPALRGRRAITIQDLHNSLTSNYSDPAERQSRMKDIMGFTRERRAKDFTEDEDEYYLESEEIVSRSQFPKSWLWKNDEDLPQCPSQDKHCTTTELTNKGFMKDSITSWQVTAISISKTHGICVSDPYEMIVLKDFFIDLKLPYSVVRNEQIEIKAILYNYNDYDIKVRLELSETPDVCSVATKKGKHHTSIEMDPMTSRAIPFVIIPMQLGKHTIEVKGAVYDSYLTDGVKKDLLVVSEGVRTEVRVKTVILKPTEHGGEQVKEFLSQIPKKQVPGTPATTYFTVAEYTPQANQEDQNLEIDIKVSGRTKPIKWVFNKENSYLTRSEKIDINQNMTVTARGTGEATLSVMTLYYAKPSEITIECKMFDLEVKLEKQNKVTYQGASETYLLTIDVLYLSKDRAATMSILDIGLLTGFSVDETDLTKLSTGADRYIQKFEMDKMLSDRGSLIIYLDKISNKGADKIAFRIHKVMNVGLLQPAAVTVYEYLDMDNRCVRFYHPKKKGGDLNKICYKDICKCVEESCCEKKTGAVDNGERSAKACEPGVDYVYKVTVENTDLTVHTDTYHMKVNQVIKMGNDSFVDSQMRKFIAHPNCREKVALEKGKTYLIMGHRDDVVPLEGGSLQYLLGHATWLEYWPTEQESKSSQEYGDAYAAFTQFALDIMICGCRI